MMNEITRGLRLSFALLPRGTPPPITLHETGKYPFFMFSSLREIGFGGRWGCSFLLGVFSSIDGWTGLLLRDSLPWRLNVIVGVLAVEDRTRSGRRTYNVQWSPFEQTRSTP